MQNSKLAECVAPKTESFGQQNIPGVAVVLADLTPASRRPRVRPNLPHERPDESDAPGRFMAPPLPHTHQTSHCEDAGTGLNLEMAALLSKPMQTIHTYKCNFCVNLGILSILGYVNRR